MLGAKYMFLWGKIYVFMVKEYNSVTKKMNDPYDILDC